MTAETATLLWSILAACGVIIGALVGALYLRLVGLLDKTADTLQAVAQSHDVRISILEAKQ